MDYLLNVKITFITDLGKSAVLNLIINGLPSKQLKELIRGTLSHWF